MAFKDHLVTWVEEYLVLIHGRVGAAAIMADIDRRYVHVFIICVLLFTSDIVALQQYRISLGCVDSPKADISSNGPVTTPKL